MAWYSKNRYGPGRPWTPGEFVYMEEGKIIHEAEYDMVTELNEHGFAGIKKNDK